jgi:molybdate transport system permease protein
MMEYGPFLLSFKLALVTTSILFLLGIPLAYWLAFNPKKYKIFLEAVVALPLGTSSHRFGILFVTGIQS